MATCNIPSSIEDPNYRYTMPRVRAKIEGRGNGIRTNIMNMGDIARALKRPPEYPTKFCGCELGSQSKFEAAEGKAIVNGAHTDATLQQIIDKFVEKFVLCPGCHLPEIDLAVSKGRVRGICNACGFQGDMDNAHRTASYILKNPPAGGDLSTMGKKAKKSKEERRAEKVAKSRTTIGSYDEEDERAVAAAVDESAEKKHKHKHKHHKKESSEDGTKERKHKTKKEKDVEVEAEGEDSGSGHRHHHKKEKKEKKKEKSAVPSKGEESPKAAAEHEDESEAEGEVVEGSKLLDKEKLGYESSEIQNVVLRIRNFLEHEGGNPSAESFFQEVRVLQVAQDFDATMRVYVTLAALYPASLLTPTKLKQRLSLLQAVCDRSVKGNMVLTAFEALLASVATESYPYYAKICSILYDEDLVDEDEFLSHYTSEETAEPFQKAKAACAPFVKWLRDADVESGGDDNKDTDEEDGEEGDLTAAGRFKEIGVARTQPSLGSGHSEGGVPSAAVTKSNKDEDEDDVDVDDL